MNNTKKWAFKWDCRLEVSGESKKIGKLSEITGLIPHQQSLIGESTGSKHYPYAKVSNWSARIEGEPDYSLRILLDRLLPIKEEFQAFLDIEKLEARLTLVEYTSSGDSGCMISKALFEGIAELKLDLTCPTNDGHSRV